MFNLPLIWKLCFIYLVLIFLRYPSIFFILMKPTTQNTFVLCFLSILQWLKVINLVVNSHCIGVAESATLRYYWDKSTSRLSQLGKGCLMLLSLIAPKNKCLTNTWNTDETFDTSLLSPEIIGTKILVNWVELIKVLIL